MSLMQIGLLVCSFLFCSFLLLNYDDVAVAVFVHSQIGSGNLYLVLKEILNNLLTTLIYGFIYILVEIV